MTNNLSLLGSTGSIGTQALIVAEKLKINVLCMAANSNYKLMEQQVRQFKPRLAVMNDEKAAKELKLLLRDTGTEVDTGVDGLCRCAAFTESDTVLNSLVGMAGLVPTLEAANAKKKIALANKETLVAGGELVMSSVKENGVELLPVDSEHSAVFQCLSGSQSQVKKIILTASGGPFWGRSREDLTKVTKEQALRHPNWEMGAKITIDSATMMNKGLEIIEAAWLFGLESSKIDVLVHRQSIVHSMVQYVDNSIIAQLGVPDMTIPIQYSLTYPKRLNSPSRELDLTKTGGLTFEKPDEETFSCMRLARRALGMGGLTPAIMNGANEKAVELFLHDKIKFYQIPEFVETAMNSLKNKQNPSIQDILEADLAARETVNSLC